MRFGTYCSFVLGLVPCSAALSSVRLLTIASEKQVRFESTNVTHATNFQQSPHVVQVIAIHASYSSLIKLLHQVCQLHAVWVLLPYYLPYHATHVQQKRLCLTVVGSTKFQPWQAHFERFHLLAKQNSFSFPHSTSPSDETRDCKFEHTCFSNQSGRYNECDTSFKDHSISLEIVRWDGWERFLIPSFVLTAALRIWIQGKGSAQFRQSGEPRSFVSHSVLHRRRLP